MSSPTLVVEVATHEYLLSNQNRFIYQRRIPGVAERKLSRNYVEFRSTTSGNGRDLSHNA